MIKSTKLLILIGSMAIFTSCGGDGEQAKEKPSIQVRNERQSTTDTEEEESATTTDPAADAMNNKGIGPIESVELGDVDQGLVSQGEELFQKNCTACHKPEKRYIGPALAGVTERRTPEWIMNMILNPTEMIQKDPLAKQLVSEYNGAVMADQNITEEQARAMLEYFRTL